MKNNLLKEKPSLTPEDLREAYSTFPNFLFFTTVKTGVRNCRCTACGEVFKSGINVLHRTTTYEWRIADSAKHGQEIRCPICGERVKVINTKLQKRLNDPRIEISKATVFFKALSYDDVWITCYFINRTYSADGASCIDEQFETNAYHLTPNGADFFKRPWSCVFGWNDTLYLEDNFREPFKWNQGLMHRVFPYSFIYSSELKLNDTFLKYSGYEEYLHKYPNAPMLQYWCWYCEHPHIEMLSKLGHTETVSEIIKNDSDMPRLLDWSAKKPWELYRLSKQEYQTFLKIFSGYRINALKMYQTLKTDDIKALKICGDIVDVSHSSIGVLLNIARRARDSGEPIAKALKDYEHIIRILNGSAKDAVSLELRIRRYGRPVNEVIKYFERISRNSAGCCWQCPGITTREVMDMWIDYINMGDNGKRNFNPYPADLKAAHDNLLDAYRIKEQKKTAAALKKEQKALIAKLTKKYPKANENCKALHDKYYYDNGTYAFVTPNSLADVLIDGKVLDQCTARPDFGGENWRYFERINSKETYIGFVRKSDTQDVPWFTIEFEPGGTVRQKRAEHDSQPAIDTKIVNAFLNEWQAAILPRLKKSDFADAKIAKIERLKQFDELRRTKKTINYGELAGTLLIDAFERDLMEAEIEIA